MATAADLRRLAFALAGTTDAPHFDRTAFKVARIFATLAADGLTANLRFSPAQQMLKAKLFPDAYQALPNAWGKQGWTCVQLSEVDADELAAALEAAWELALPTPKKRRKK